MKRSNNYFRNLCLHSEFFLRFVAPFVEVSVIHFREIVISKIERRKNSRTRVDNLFHDFLRKSRREKRFSQPVGGDLFIYHRYCGVAVTGVIYMRITDDREVKSKFKWVAGTFHKRQKLFFEHPLSPLFLVARRACAYIVSIYIEACRCRRHGERRQKTKIKKLRNTCCCGLTRHRTNMNY